jgi:hypothetical protein
MPDRSTQANASLLDPAGCSIPTTIAGDLSRGAGIARERGGAPVPRAIILTWLQSRIARTERQRTAMKRSTDRILTTHVGSLIRPEPLQEFMRAKQAGKSYDQAAYEKCLKGSVADAVRRQAEIGVDVVSDG